jgi:hypothetical protein
VEQLQLSCAESATPFLTIKAVSPPPHEDEGGD